MESTRFISVQTRGKCFQLYTDFDAFDTFPFSCALSGEGRDCAGCKPAPDPVVPDTPVAAGACLAALETLEFTGLEQGLSLAHRVFKLGKRRGELLLQIGWFYRHLGRSEAGVGYITQALTIAREAGDRRLEGYVLHYQAVSHLDRAAIEAATLHITQALVIAREVGDRRLEALVLGIQGNLHSDLGHLEEAETNYNQALRINREMGNRRSEGILLGNLGTLYKEQGRLKDAEAHLTQSLAFHREVGNRSEEGIALGRLGIVLAHQGDYITGIQYLTEGECILREFDERLELAVLLCSRAQGEFIAQRPVAANVALTEAETIAAKLGMDSSSALGQEIAAVRKGIANISPL